MDSDHMLLACRAVQFMDSQLVASASMVSYLTKELSSAHMVTLANIIKDLDQSVGPHHKVFAQAIQRFVHNLFARGVLSQPLQDVLLTTLGRSSTFGCCSSSFCGWDCIHAIRTSFTTPGQSQRPAYAHPFPLTFKPSFGLSYHKSFDRGCYGSRLFSLI